MADITKLVDFNQPANSRSQHFSEADAGTGDILLIKDSLKKPAKTVSIKATAAMTVRFNVYRTIFPDRTLSNGLVDAFGNVVPNVSQGVQVQDSTNAAIPLGAGETFEIDGDMPVNDIEIVSASGAFSIFVV